MRFFETGAVAAVRIAASPDPAGGTRDVDARLKCGHGPADRFES
jgi:hypothetical protein